MVEGVETEMEIRTGETIGYDKVVQWHINRILSIGSDPMKSRALYTSIEMLEGITAFLQDDLYRNEIKKLDIWLSRDKGGLSKRNRFEYVKKKFTILASLLDRRGYLAKSRVKIDQRYEDG